MTRKSKARIGLARTYRISPTVKALRQAILAGCIASVPVYSHAATLPVLDMTVVSSVLAPAALSGALVVGVDQSAPGNVDIVNDNDYALSDTEVIGLRGISTLADTTIINNADLDLYATAQYAAQAYGIVASAYSDSAVSNNGLIDVTAYSYAEGAFAVGVIQYAADAAFNSSVDSQIDVYANGYTHATAVGLVAFANDSATISNQGTITVGATSAVGSANAYGMYVLSGGQDPINGAASIENSGNISVSAMGDQLGTSAIGIGAFNYASDVLINNSGDIHIDSNGLAIAIVGNTGSGAVDISNSGDLTVYANGEGRGIRVSSGSTADVTNTGDIFVDARNDNASPMYCYDIWDPNACAGAEYGVASAIGIDVHGYSDVSVTNSGDMTISGESLMRDFDGTGIKVESYIGDAYALNSGDIQITDNNPNGHYVGQGSGKFFYTDVLHGVTAKSAYGDAIISNSGQIDLVGGESSIGLYATTEGGYYGYYGGSVDIQNSGDIQVTINRTQSEQQDFAAWAVGIYAAGSSKYGGSVNVTNSGDITLDNLGNTGGVTGIVATNSKYSGGVTITNSGDITADTGSWATGISASAENYCAFFKPVCAPQDVAITNSGDIHLTIGSGPYGNAWGLGIEASAEIGTVTVDNSGDIKIDGDVYYSFAIIAKNREGDVNIQNSGDLDVLASGYNKLTDYYGSEYFLGGFAVGIQSQTRIGISSVDNSGDIRSDAQATGVGIASVSQFGAAQISNSGDISVDSHLYNAYGLVTRTYALQSYFYGEPGFSQISNSGDISVHGYAMAAAIYASNSYSDITVENTGNLSVNAEYGFGGGIMAHGDFSEISIKNDADISVVAGGSAGGILADTAGGYGRYGYFVGYGDVSITSSGDIKVSSQNERASAITARSSLGALTLDVSGSLDVNASGRGTGISANTRYGNIDIDSSADIQVHSSHDYATGMQSINWYGETSIYSSGDIEVSSTSLATGISAVSYSADAEYGYVNVINYGAIKATSSAGTSIGIHVASQTGAYVYNAGHIEAIGSDAWAISGNFGAIYVTNAGEIAGSIRTDDQDDVLLNTVDGKIFMENSKIYMYDGVNQFINDGELYANGTMNTVDVGALGEFINNGNSIHMDDGAADDVLHVVGDFSGTGSVHVDVSGAHLISDQLIIDGDVLAGTQNTVNVHLLDLPNVADMLNGSTIDIISVSGAHTPGNFVLGQVSSANNSLLSMDYHLNHDGNVFGLGFDLKGLSSAGVMLSSLSPAMQSLWFGQNGTMYQRQGGERNFGHAEGKAATGTTGSWARVYSDDGQMQPDAYRGNFGSAGAQDFAFNNTGIELGFGYSFNPQWTVGVMGGSMDGNVSAIGGRTQVSANTQGAYVTYMPGNGLYADISMRNMDFDTESLVNGNMVSGRGTARGYAMELGYGFASKSGFEFEPQLQYSAVDVSLHDMSFGGQEFSLTDGKSSQLRAGFAARRTWNAAGGMWTPQVVLSHVQTNGAGNRYLIGGAAVGGVDMSGSSQLLEAGVTAKYGEWVFSGGLNWKNGGAYDSVLGGQFNVRYSW